jgi:hypothetical protein
MEISGESWKALTDGQIRDSLLISDLQSRLVKMAGQVERLSWLLEKTVEWYVEPEYNITLEDIEDNWVTEG